jgi:enoyl-CoA hydratase
VGASRAKELIFSGRFVGAEEALEMGLVDELVAPDGVYDAAVAWAGRFADTSTAAIALAKALVDASPGTGLDAGLDADTQTRRYGEVFDAAGGQLGCPL